MENKKVQVEGYGKGSGQPFHRRNFNKKDPMFKYPTFGIYTSVFSYEKPKDVDVFIK